jgi:hypothetical protein
MFALTIMGIDLNHPTKRYFDIILKEKAVTVGLVDTG